MRRAVNPIHSLRRCSMWCFSSYRRCLGLGAVEGALLLGPFRSLTVYLYVCLLWEQGRQVFIIRGLTQDYVMPKSDYQKNARQTRHVRGTSTDDVKSRNVRQSTISVNTRVNILEPGEQKHPPTSSAVQTIEKAPTPARELEHRTTSPTPPLSLAENGLKFRSYQELKSPKLMPLQSSLDMCENYDEDISNWTPGRPRPPKPKNAITIAVSSRTLFNMREGHKIFEKEGLEKYMEYQITNENTILKPGPAFGFVKALQHVNARLRSLYPSEQDLFDIVLISNNHAQVGLRLLNSINHHGIAAATIYLGNKDLPFLDTQLRVALDGDALIFSDDFIPNVHVKGIDKAIQQESFHKDKSLAQGPLKQFLQDLGRLQKKFYAKNERLLCPIRTYLITARSAASSGARVLKLLYTWGLEVDEALFLAGAPKGPVLAKIRPHIFFDDDMYHLSDVHKFGTTVASVPFFNSRKTPRSLEGERK
ncbi:cytosolic 5'-nucleotidase 1B isoform X3 [Macrotis lagotis]|uniref:cytosolic 5'-nucleotidase 1B isoform X3 n=1 Tax=Macrotis lagotis TaxID=92651 RepID=UPI003D692CBE